MATRPRAPQHYRNPPPGVELPLMPVHLRRRRWRQWLRLHGVAPSAIRLLSRCRQRKPASWLDLRVRDLPTLYMADVIDKVEIGFLLPSAVAAAAPSRWTVAVESGALTATLNPDLDLEAPATSPEAASAPGGATTPNPETTP